MRILLAAPHYPPSYVAGVELHTRRIATWLAARGHHPSVVCIERFDKQQKEAVSLVQVDEGPIPVHRLVLNPDLKGEPFRSMYHDPDLEQWFDRYIRETRPDVVHVQSGYLVGGAALAAAQTHGLPTLASLHDYWFFCPRVTLLHPNGEVCDGPDPLVKCGWCIATEQRRYRLPDRVTSGLVGQGAQQALNMTGGAWFRPMKDVTERRADLGTVLRRTTVVMMATRRLADLAQKAGVDPSRIEMMRYGLTERMVRPRLPGFPESGRLVLGFFGQITPHKGPHVLIDAVKRLPNAPIEVQIHGPMHREPAYAARLQALTGDDPRIVFRGAFQHTTFANLIASIDAMVIPSLWHEPGPTVMWEAFDANVPIVASRLGGMSENVIDGVNGLLYAPGDAADLAAQIQRVFDNPGLLAELRAGIAPVPTFDTEMDHLMSVYDRMLGSPSSAGADANATARA